VLSNMGLTSIAEHLPATPGFLVAIARYGGDWQQGDALPIILLCDAIFFSLLVACFCARSWVTGSVGIVLLSALLSGLANLFSVPMSNALILHRLQLTQSPGLFVVSPLHIGDQHFWTALFFFNLVALVVIFMAIRWLTLRLTSLLPYEVIKFDPRKSAAK